MLQEVYRRIATKLNDSTILHKVFISCANNIGDITTEKVGTQ